VTNVADTLLSDADHDVLGICSRMCPRALRLYSPLLFCLSDNDLFALNTDLRLTAFISWTLFTALIPSLFYFSVWKLGIAGHELAFAAVLSPALLSVKFGSLYDYVFGSASEKSTKYSPPTKPQLHALACTPRGQIILRLVSLLGLVAYIIPSPGGRLACVFMAVGAEMMRAVVSWAAMIEVDSGSNIETTGKPQYEGLIFGLTLLLNSALKMANRGNNPSELYDMDHVGENYLHYSQFGLSSSTKPMDGTIRELSLHCYRYGNMVRARV
jgi:hypothetical protein